MQHYLKLGFTITLLTILFTGILSFESILPSSTDGIVEAKDLTAEASEEEIPDPIEEPLEEPIPPILIDENTKVAYLTFDDGPSPRVTPAILDILKEYEIQATFFVIGNLAEKNPDLLLRMDAEGHLVSNHTYTHRYRFIYANPQNLLEELRITDEVLTGILGDRYRSNIMRFPGGSFGEKLRPFREAVKEAGYRSIDWNVLNGDAEGKKTTAIDQLNRIKESLQNKKHGVVLMHDSDTKLTTVEALPQIIEYLSSQGYIFRTLEHYPY